jgi:cobaltochelatase CobS
MDYVGRNALDAATLDRFATLEMRYDQALERRIALLASAGNEALAQAWLETVQAMRAACHEHEIRHIVSPRATQQGLRLLCGGITAEGATIMVLRRGLDETTWGRIRHRLADFLPRVEAARAAMPAQGQGVA